MEKSRMVNYRSHFGSTTATTILRKYGEIMGTETEN